MEKCMMATSLALLLCHPNSNPKCSNSCKATKPKPKPEEQQIRRRSRRNTVTTPQLIKPRKIKQLEFATSTMTQLRLVYDRLESSKYVSIRALEAVLRRGWGAHSRLVIDEVLKVTHEQGVVDKFEKYRELVKQKASKNVIVNKRYYKKFMEDGFELLCFIGSKLACREKSSSRNDDRVCRKRYCGVCRLIGAIESSSSDCLHSVSVSESAWMAHQKAVSRGGDCRKAVIVCRVIAGRVADHHRRRRRIKGNDDDDSSSVKIGEDDYFDSVLVPISDSDAHDELLVFNVSAILPCFVVLYDVQDL